MAINILKWTMRLFALVILYLCALWAIAAMPQTWAPRAIVDVLGLVVSVDFAFVLLGLSAALPGAARKVAGTSIRDAPACEVCQADPSGTVRIIAESYCPVIDKLLCHACVASHKNCQTRHIDPRSALTYRAGFRTVNRR